MSENTTPAACTEAEWKAALAAGLPFEDPGSTAFERALHAFAEAVRADLLEALQLLISGIESNCIADNDLPRARAAVAKATGSVTC